MEWGRKEGAERDESREVKQVAGHIRPCESLASTLEGGWGE